MACGVGRGAGACHNGDGYNPKGVVDWCQPRHGARHPRGQDIANGPSMVVVGERELGRGLPWQQPWLLSWDQCSPWAPFPALAPALVTPQLPALAQGDDPPTPEMRCRRFQGFLYQYAKGTRGCSRLRELCQRWLEPQCRSKDQMLELAVLGQFLAILPRETWSWQRGCSWRPVPRQ
ncbi:hypothetical protein Y1Q_0011186 [Alligator mississippiensis]|uniref:SCAN box domain-containing protein n=1 Tax=Alligator mississippiensis TaxID=8496 RepID=A0A151MRT2_ALLMI|nr:hypothetical protein Y1Q_0011186 [Alligator mississippiensis]